MNFIPDAFAADAAKALVHLSALDDLRERGWLADIDGGWEIANGHYAACSTGEKLLLDTLDHLCGGPAVALTSIAARLDERNRTAVLGAIGVLFSVATAAPVVGVAS